MWQLDEAQLAAIGRATFGRRAADALAQIYPAQAPLFGSDAFRKGLVPLIERAQKHGLLSERSVFHFLHAAWIFGPEFDEKVPPLKALLADEALEAELKADRLRDAVRVTLETLGAAAAPPPTTKARS